MKTPVPPSADRPLNYVVHPGKLPHCLFLHGIGGSHDYWGLQLESAVGSLSQVQVDLLGFGKSSQPSGPYTMDRHLSSLCGVTKKVCGEAPLVVIAHSFGTLLAMCLLQKANHPILGMVLLNTPIFQSDKEAHETLLSGSIQYQLAMGKVNFKKLQSKSSSWSWEALFRLITRMPARVLRAQKEGSLHAMRSTLRECVLAYRPYEAMEVLRKIPTLFIHGALDQVAPWSHVEKELKSLPLSQSHLIAQGGHHIWHTHQDEVFSAIHHFLNKLRV